MEQNIFRKKSIDKINSPESLNDYIRVSNPSVWLILSAVIIFLAGVLVWGIFGHIDTTVKCYAVVEENKAVCYVLKNDIPSIEKGMPVVVNGKEGKVTKIGSYDEDRDSYEVYADIPVENGSYFAEFVTKKEKPISFILN